MFEPLAKMGLFDSTKNMKMAVISLKMQSTESIAFRMHCKTFPQSNMLPMDELMGDQNRKKFPDLISWGLSPPSSSNSLFCWNKTYIIEYPKASRATELAPGAWELFSVQKGSNLS